MFIEHEAVVHAHGFHRGAPGENCLAAAAVAREVVVHDGARHDDVVYVADMFVDPHGRAAARGAEVFKVFLLGAGAVVHLKARGDVFPDGFHHFFVGHVAVGAQREEDVHVFVFDAQLIHFVNEHRHEVKAVGDAGGIVADEGHGVAGLHDFIDGLTADRMVDGVQNACLHIFHHRKFFSADFLDDEVFIIIKRLAAVPVGEIVGLHSGNPLVVGCGRLMSSLYLSRV